LDIRGRLELPPGQGAVIALNHISSVDPFFIQLLPDRVVRWMVAREFIAHWSFGWFLRFVEVIPTNRTGIDAAAIRQAIRYASEGGLVGMLPEGRVNMTDRPMLPVRPGTAMVAMRAGVPIIPCHIAGVWYTGSPWSPFFFPARVRLRVGEPVDTVAYRDRPDEREAAEELTLVVVGRIARLGGWTGFQPRLATREWKPSDDELAVNMGAVARRPQDTRRCE
jgi:1-acyl-sn-glycerol-3-phosphate acyltransferase